MQQEDKRRKRVGLFLNPVGQRRVDFQERCGPLFDHLYLADGTEQANLFLVQQSIDLLIIDLARFDRGFDLAALGDVLIQRGQARTLLICPFTHAGWLPDLMAFGPVEYVIGPVVDQALYDVVAARLDTPERPESDGNQLRALLATSARLQQAVSEVDDLEKMADQICIALGSLAGVVHVSLFHMRDMGDLQLEAQHSSIGLNLTRILHRADRLLQSPLRHAFPGLLAACGGEMALLDVPAKAGEPELAIGLLDARVEMIVGVPLPVSRAGALRGSLCLMFDHARQFSSDEIAAFVTLAQLAGFGLRMAEMSRENEHLLGRLTHLATTDALTGIANRRHGE